MKCVRLRACGFEARRPFRGRFKGNQKETRKTTMFGPPMLTHAHCEGWVVPRMAECMVPRLETDCFVFF